MVRRHHPLEGQVLEVATAGPTQIVVHLRDGTTMRLPRAWTDADGTPVPNSSVRVFSVDSMRGLIEVLDALRRRA